MYIVFRRDATLEIYHAPANMGHWPRVDSMLAHRLRRRANFEPSRSQSPVHAGSVSVIFLFFNPLSTGVDGTDVRVLIAT